MNATHFAVSPNTFLTEVGKSLEFIYKAVFEGYTGKLENLQYEKPGAPWDAFFRAQNSYMLTSPAFPACALECW